MPAELFHRFEKAAGVKLMEGYGMTEATCLVSINPPDGERRIGSVGLPFPYTRRCGSSTATPRAAFGGHAMPMRSAIFCVKNPGVDLEVYTDPALNRGVIAEGGFLRTGDLGRIDADGYIWITGRAKDLIIRGGHNIDPAMIEEALMDHPAVAFAGAIGQPDAHSGEVPAVYVELVAGTTATEADLIAHARARIAEPAAVPKYLEIVPELPKTAVGKVFKPDLRRRAIARVFDAALARAGATARVVDVVEDRRLGLVAELAPPAASGADGSAAALASYVVPWRWKGSA